MQGEVYALLVEQNRIAKCIFSIKTN